MLTISVLGLGAMGSRIAHNLLQAGFPVTVYNRSAERAAPLVAAGARLAPTPRAAAEGADVVLSMVRDEEASRAVWLDAETGAIHSLRPGTVAVEMSTLTPAWTQELAGLVAATGAELLEAPVLGTRPQAEARQLIVLAGGAAEALERVRPALTATASAMHHIGPVGAAGAMKLAVNTLYGVQVAIWAEMLTLLERQGIGTTQAVEVLNTLPTTSPALQVAGRLMAAGTYAPLFPIALVAKDFGYALALAEGLGVASPLLAATRAVYEDAVGQGFGGDNIVGVTQLYAAMGRPEAPTTSAGG